MAHFLAKFCVCNLHYSDEIKRLKGIKLTDSEETFTHPNYTKLRYFVIHFGSGIICVFLSFMNIFENYFLSVLKFAKNSY